MDGRKISAYTDPFSQPEYPVTSCQPHNVDGQSSIASLKAHMYVYH